MLFSFLKIQSNIHRARRMRERADGNEIHAAAGNGMDVSGVYAAAGLSPRVALDLLHRQPQLNRVHVVEQNEVRAGIGGLFGLLQSIGLDFNFQLGKFFTRPRHGGGDGVRFLVLQCDEVE